MDEVRVVTFEQSYAKSFAELNYEWIAEYYQIEKHDNEQLDTPTSWQKWQFLPLFREEILAIG